MVKDIEEYIENNILLWKISERDRHDFDLIYKLENNYKIVSVYKFGSMFIEDDGTETYMFSIGYNNKGELEAHIVLDTEQDMLQNLINKNIKIVSYQMGFYEFIIDFDNINDMKSFFNNNVWNYSFGCLY